MVEGADRVTTDAGNSFKSLNDITRRIIEETDTSRSDAFLDILVRFITDDINISRRVTTDGTDSASVFTGDYFDGLFIEI